MMEIYGRSDSSNCAKIFWLLDAMNLTAQTIPTGGSHGGTDRASYLELNPNGKVPTLLDDGVAIWESHAIMRYIAGRYGPTALYPEPFAIRAVVDMWLDWIATTLNPALGTLRRANSEAAVSSAMPAALSAFEILDAQLGKNDFVCGKSMSLADIAIAPHVMRWYRLKHDLPSLKSLQHYLKQLQTDPLYTTHVEQSLDLP